MRFWGQPVPLKLSRLTVLLLNRPERAGLPRPDWSGRRIAMPQRK